MPDETTERPPLREHSQVPDNEAISGIKDIRDRRKGKDRRSGRDRRRISLPIGFRERRSQRGTRERRSGLDRRNLLLNTLNMRIPIFVKLAISSTLLVLLITLVISLFILQRQEDQFTYQLINFGKGIIRIIASNTPDKLLAEEDLALFQLLRDVAKDDQVVYSLILDKDSVVRAHSRIDQMNIPYKAPNFLGEVTEKDNIKTGAIRWGGKEVLLFMKPITYQGFKVGEAHLAISQERIKKSMREGKVFFILLALAITTAGILISLFLSIYFSRPIRTLREGTRALGGGNLSYRVQVTRNDELGDLGTAFNKMAADLEMKEKIKDSFGRYVTPEIVDMVLANPDSDWMRGKQVVASVLFVDIRGFTSLSEDLAPEEVIELLNRYFSKVTDIIMKYGGHINKFLGDSIMVVFGAPLPNSDHAESAVKAGLEIREAMSRAFVERDRLRISIRVGIGINSGTMVAGNLGSQKRMEYTVIGDAVNIASRLTSLARADEILIGEGTYDFLRDKGSLSVEEKGEVSLKGRKGEVSIYSIKSWDGKAI